MNTPAELWLHHRTDVAERGGEPVFAALMLQIDRPATLTISRASANPTQPQGLVLDGELPSPSTRSCYRGWFCGATPLLRQCRSMSSRGGSR